MKIQNYFVNQAGRLAINGSGMDVRKLCQEGRLKEALQIMDLLVQRGTRSSINTFECLLQGCIRMRALAEGKRVHAHIVQSGFEANILLANTLVNMYAKCGSVLDARRVFDKLPEPDVVSWTTIILAYAKQGQGEEAVYLFQQMLWTGVAFDKVVFLVVLKACASPAALEWGKQIHAHVIKMGLELDPFVANALLSMYAKCGSIEDASQVFNRMHKKDAVIWTAMIAGYAQQGYGKEALTLFDQMQQEGVKPDCVTFVSVLIACAKLAVLERGKQIHALISERGFESNVTVGNALVSMYAKCGSIDNACLVFNRMQERDVVTWTTMIEIYGQQGHGEEAFILFERMQEEGVKPNYVTFVSILKACASQASLERGKQIHGHVIKSGIELDVFVGSTLVDMYAKCGSIENARQVFNGMHERNVVSWTAMIAGYAKEGHGEEALTLFEEMQREGVKPNNVTFVSIIKACASLGALQRGKQIHAHAIEYGFESDASVKNSLVDMYAKCGDIEVARQMFDKMHERNAILWTAIISGYAQQGRGEEALALFEQMQQEGVKPEDATFLSLLSACSHAGLVDEGFRCFDSMSRDHGITPTWKHYVCMVDLLGRAGCLDQAEALINKMPIQPNAVVWMALLSACRSQGNVELGRHAFECVLKVEPKCYGAYVLISNIYAAAGRWDEAAKVRKAMEESGGKEPGCSWIEVNNEVHAFFVTDRTHPQSKEVEAELKNITWVMEEEGYVPNLGFVLHDIWGEQKEGALCNHIERLSIGFGLISMPPGTPIHIKKNLRVCGDCHNVTKIISRIVGREIIVRDADRFHHFKDGVCTCRD